MESNPDITLLEAPKSTRMTTRSMAAKRLQEKEPKQGRRRQTKRARKLTSTPPSSSDSDSDSESEYEESDSEATQSDSEYEQSDSEATQSNSEYEQSDSEYEPTDDDVSVLYEDAKDMARMSRYVVDEPIEEDEDEDEDEVAAEKKHQENKKEIYDEMEEEEAMPSLLGRGKQSAAKALFLIIENMTGGRVVGGQNDDDEDDCDMDNCSKKTRQGGKKSAVHENPKYREYSHAEKQFYNSLTSEQKQLVAASEAAASEFHKESTPLRFRILLSAIDDTTKAIALKKLSYLENMSPSSGEYSKMSNWIDSLCRIPFGMYRGIPLIRNQERQSFDPAEVSQFLSKTQAILDNTVYGHKESKDQIIRFLAQWIVNPQSKGSVIGIHGKPGVGKTTLVKDGICRALDMPFAFIPLGGASDGSYLEGHNYTYEGSTWGKIVDVIMKAGCMNPILYFDELDKVSHTFKGEEIINILIHLTDPGQNDHFGDKYFMDIPIDLSKAIIIFTYNDDSLINPILKDRMIRISANDYTDADKIQISRQHLIPSLNRQFKFSDQDIVFSDETIRYLISRIDEEAGVRNLRRALELLFSTINLQRLLPASLTTTTNSSTASETALSTLPVTLTSKLVNELLKKHKMERTKDSAPPMFMYS